MSDEPLVDPDTPGAGNLVVEGRAIIEKVVRERAKDVCVRERNLMTGRWETTSLVDLTPSRREYHIGRFVGRWESGLIVPVVIGPDPWGELMDLVHKLEIKDLIKR